ncbi:hypothetical protein CVUC_05225 [Caulobacter vibrioides]|nr:hypothetical protein CA608_11920 [Caulobacter vibrioides]PLR13953.1 hypothetical protein CVUC_05225 [Caulobacter vibrioides]
MMARFYMAAIAWAACSAFVWVLASYPRADGPQLIDRRDLILVAAGPVTLVVMFVMGAAAILRRALQRGEG